MRPTRLITLLAGAVISCHFTWAYADTTNGHELLQRCSAYEKSLASPSLNAEETLDAMWCMGYVSGLLDGFGVSDYRIGNAIAACPGDSSITRGEAVKIVTGWLRQHPEDLDKSGRRNAILAIAKAFPCQSR